MVALGQETAVWQLDYIPERIIPETRVDAGRGRLPVEMGTLTMWPGEEAGAENRNQRLLGVQKRKRALISNLSFQGRKNWLAPSSVKGQHLNSSYDWFSMFLPFASQA